MTSEASETTQHKTTKRGAAWLPFLHHKTLLFPADLTVFADAVLRRGVSGSCGVPWYACGACCDAPSQCLVLPWPAPIPAAVHSANLAFPLRRSAAPTKSL